LNVTTARNPTGALVPTDQLAVHADRVAARRQPQHGRGPWRRLAIDHLDDAVGEQRDEIVVIRHHHGAEALAGSREPSISGPSGDRAAGRGGLTPSPFDRRPRL